MLDQISGLPSAFLDFNLPKSKMFFWLLKKLGLTEACAASNQKNQTMFSMFE